jgi:hypothetical protein
MKKTSLFLKLLISKAPCIFRACRLVHFIVTPVVIFYVVALQFHDSLVKLF